MKEAVGVEDRREPGWWWASNALVDDERVDGHALAVYGVLARHANREGRCWPSTRRLAKMVRFGLTKVHRALSCLEATGYLRVERRRTQQGDRDVSIYVLVERGGCSATGSRDLPGDHRDLPRDHGGDLPGDQNKTYPSEQDPLNKRTRVSRHKDETPWPGTDAVLTEATRLYAKARGCRNVRLAVEHAGNDALAKGRMQRDWLAYMRKWLDNHGRYGCPCLKPVIPAYVPKREPVTGPFAGLTVGRKIV